MDTEIKLDELDINNEFIIDLPEELILHICSFLEAVDVLQGLACTCKHFYETLTAPAWWKSRLSKRWPNKLYPAVGDRDAREDWAVLCMERERSERRWSDIATYMDEIRLSYGIFAAVDCVHLVDNGKILISGSRDRYINAWNLDNDGSNEKQMKILSNNKAHKGWVWCLDSHGNQLSSGSWDTHVKLWDMRDDFHQLSDFKLKSAVLCMEFSENRIECGGFDRKVTSIDTRVGITSVRNAHTKPVLCLAERGDLLLTLSEDSTMVFYDRRAAKELQVLKFPQREYPTSCYWENDTLWVGNAVGGLTLIDTSGTEATVIEQYLIHRKQVTGVLQTTGFLVTCSKDKLIKVLQPSRDPDVICTLNLDSSDDVSGLNFQNDILAAACGGAVKLWRSRDS